MHSLNLQCILGQLVMLGHRGLIRKFPGSPSSVYSLVFLSSGLAKVDYMDIVFKQFA